MSGGLPTVTSTVMASSTGVLKLTLAALTQRATASTGTGFAVTLTTTPSSVALLQPCAMFDYIQMCLIFIEKNNSDLRLVFFNSNLLAYVN